MLNACQTFVGSSCWQQRQASLESYYQAQWLLWMQEWQGSAIVHLGRWGLRLWIFHPVQALSCDSWADEINFINPQSDEAYDFGKASNSNRSLQ